MPTPKNNDSAWDERTLGAEEQYVVRADKSHEQALDDAMEMQAISIRLPRQLIEHYKLIAHFHGVGYQPLMRDVMARWVPKALEEIFEAEQAKANKASKSAEWVEGQPRKVA